MSKWLFIASYYRQLSADIKIYKNIRLTSVLLTPRCRRPRLTKLLLILWFFNYYLWKIVCNTMLYIIFSMAENPADINLFWSHTGRTNCWLMKTNVNIWEWQNKYYNLYFYSNKEIYFFNLEFKKYVSLNKIKNKDDNIHESEALKR